MVVAPDGTHRTRLNVTHGAHGIGTRESVPRLLVYVNGGTLFARVRGLSGAPCVEHNRVGGGIRENTGGITPTPCRLTNETTKRKKF